MGVRACAYTLRRPPEGTEGGLRRRHPARSIKDMAKTLWMRFSVLLEPTTTQTKVGIIEDIFEAQELIEYTILRIVGNYSWWVGTANAVDSQAFFAFHVSDANEAATETAPLDPGNGIANVQDSEAKWMYNSSIAYHAPMVEDLWVQRTLDIETKRVVFEGEELRLTHEARAVTANTLALSMFLRILILVD